MNSRSVLIESIKWHVKDHFSVNYVDLPVDEINDFLDDLISKFELHQVNMIYGTGDDSGNRPVARFKYDRD